MKKNKRYKQAVSDMAKLLKNRDNHFWLGAITGVVTNPPPNLQVKLVNGVIVKKHKIMISIEKVEGYFREFSIEGNISEETMTVTKSSEKKDPPNNIESFTANGSYKSTGTITWTDTLKKGDLVLMLPANDHNYFYLIDRVVKL